MKRAKEQHQRLQAYEFQLLSLFGFHVEAAASHRSAYVDEFAKEFQFEERETYELENLILDTDFTHSSLCLLDKPKLVLAAICFKMNERNYRGNIRDLFTFTWNEVFFRMGGGG